MGLGMGMGMGMGMGLGLGVDRITDNLPEHLVQSLFYSVGRMKYDLDEYDCNDIWIENSQGEGTTVPLLEFEAALDKLFKKHF